MKVTVVMHPDLGACTISHEDVRLESAEDVADWRRQVVAQLAAVVGQNRVHFLVDYHGFSVSPLVAEGYGRVAEEVRRRWAKDVFRYGPTSPLSAASVRLQSMRHAHASNLYRTREDAVAALMQAYPSQGHT